MEKRLSRRTRPPQSQNAPGAAPELSLRSSLNNLLQDDIKLLQRGNQFHLVNEGTTVGVKGRPDFILLFHDSPIIRAVDKILVSSFGKKDGLSARL